MRHVRWQHSRSNRRLFLYNGESITTVISFVKVRMNYAVLVSLFHNEHVQHVWPASSNVIPTCFPMLGVLIFTCVRRERERGGLIMHSSFCKAFLFLFFFNYYYFFETFHQPSISSLYMADTYRWRRRKIEQKGINRA